MNPISIDPSILPYRFKGGGVLDRATENEISIVREKIPELISRLGMFNPLEAFETHFES
jgi:hypothetical protein